VLSDDKVEQFQRDGFTVAEGFLSAAEVKELLDDTDRICAGSTLADHDKSRIEMEPKQQPDGARVRRLYEPCSHYDRFRQLSEEGELLDSLEQLIGPDILFHYSKLNMKPAEIGSIVEWHQDLAYHPLTNRDSVAVLIYLDDTDRSNGCLRMIPGRHTVAPMDHTDGRFFQGKVTEAVDESTAVDVEGGAGTAIFMNAMTPHASALNTSTKPRRTLILSYRAADAFPVYTGEMTAATEVRVRLVRGRQLPFARFSMAEFPIPVFEQVRSSLYELQEQSQDQS
jgi:hypothetical protein